jgi:glycine/D-amino acid oxidase-like deaminating enzyme
MRRNDGCAVTGDSWSWFARSAPRMPPDGIPIIDRAPGIDGLVLAVGRLRPGIHDGPGVGKNVTSLIVDNKTCLPEEAHHCFRYDRDFYAAKKEALK